MKDALVVGTVLLAAWASGCGPACPTSERTVTGQILNDGNAQYFETSPPNGPFLPFDGATFLHVKHGLGTRPRYVQTFLSFSAHPENPGGGGSSHAAGNQATYPLVDDEEIVVKNDSCANYYIRVVAIAPLPPAVDAGDDVAGTDASDAAADSADVAETD